MKPPDESRRGRDLLRIHVAVMLFGFAVLFGDRRFLPLSSIVIVFGRTAFASLALVLAGLARRDLGGRIARRDLLGFAALGVLLAVHWTTFFQSAQDAGGALALITYSTFPVFVAFLEPLLFREQLRRDDFLLAIIVLVGIAILTPNLEMGNRVTQGVLWGIASGLTFALLSLLNRRLVRRYSSLTIALYQDFFAAAVLLPLVLAAGPSFRVRDVLLLAVLGVVCTAVSHSLFIAGMHGISARTASMIACLEPVYGTLLALALGQAPKLRTILGGIIIVGVAFYATIRAGRTNDKPGAPATG